MMASDMAGARQRRNSQFSKTKMCRFELLGMCTKGMHCPYAHGAPELKPLPDLRCTQLCRELLQYGECRNKHCTYAHSREELRTPAERGAPSRPARQRVSGGGEVRRSDVADLKTSSVPSGAARAGIESDRRSGTGAAPPRVEAGAFDWTALSAALAKGGGSSLPLGAEDIRPDWSALSAALAKGGGSILPGKVASSPVEEAPAVAQRPCTGEGRLGAEDIRPIKPGVGSVDEPMYVPLRYPSAAVVAARAPSTRGAGGPHLEDNLIAETLGQLGEGGGSYPTQHESLYFAALLSIQACARKTTAGLAAKAAENEYWQEVA